MNNKYIVYLVSDERYSTNNMQKLRIGLDNLAFLKEKYKKEFNYFFGMRSNWFGLLLLPLIDECDNLALMGFKQLLNDKKFNRVYVHNLETDRYKPTSLQPNEYYTQERIMLHFSCYEKDTEYVKNVIDKIMRRYGFLSVVEEVTK